MQEKFWNTQIQERTCSATLSVKNQQDEGLLDIDYKVSWIDREEGRFMVKILKSTERKSSPKTHVTNDKKNN